MRRYGALLLSAALVAAPVASGATRKHLKLTAVVTGHKSEMVPGWGVQKVTLYSVKQGSKKVGTLAVSDLGGCVGDTCEEAGFANLSVGKVTGKANLKTTTTYTGCSPGCGPGHPTRFKSNTGSIFKYVKHQSKAIQEAIVVNGRWPRTKGSKVTFALSY